MVTARAPDVFASWAIGADRLDLWRDGDRLRARMGGGSWFDVEEEGGALLRPDTLQRLYFEGEIL